MKPSNNSQSAAKRILSSLRRLLFIFTLIAMGGYLFYQRKELNIFLTQNPVQTAYLLLLACIPPCFNALKFKTLMQMFGVRFKGLEWFGINVCATLYNLILPSKGGSIFKAVYLKTEHGFPYRKHISLLLADYYASWLVGSAMAICLILWMNESHLPVPPLSLLPYIAALLVVMILLFFGIQSFKFSSGGFSSHFMNTMFEGLKLFTRFPRQSIQLVFFHICLLSFTAARLYFVLYLLHINLTYSQLLLIQILVNLVLVFSILPGNIGIAEGLIALLAGAAGVSVERAFLATVIDRMASLIIILISGGYFSRKLLFRRKPDDPSLKINANQTPADTPRA